MSLVRLLAAGRSLVGLKETGGRYNLSNQHLLPKFETKKNPFRDGVVQPTEAEPAAAQSSEAAVAPGAAHEAPGRPVPSVDPHRASQAKSWSTKLRSLLGRRTQSIRKPSVFRAASGLVQAELSLETVKVVRNDLSDTDLEVVTVKAEKVAPIAAGQVGESAGNAPREPKHQQAPATIKPDVAESDRPQPENDRRGTAATLVGRLFRVGKT